MTINLSRIFSVLTALLLIFLGGMFYWKGIISVDPDLGWHLQTGEMILQSGFPKTDPFSYTMSNYQYIDFEWLTDVFMAEIYRVFGLPAISLFFALISVGGLAILIPKKALGYVSPLLLLIGPVLLSGAGIRNQLITWFFLALLLKILFQKKNWLKYRLSLPVLFLFWVNMHAGFLVGYLILAYFLILRALNKEITKSDLAVTIFSFSAALVNPYGFNLLGETLKQGWLLSTNLYLKRSIDEWTPIFTRFSLALFTYFFLSCFIAIKYFKKFDLLQLGVYLGLLIMGFSARRHIPLWIIASFPLMVEGVKNIVDKISFFKLRLTVPIIIMVTGVIFINFIWYSREILHTSLMWSQTYSYPQGAISYLKSHQISRVFVPYEWGGYIIWKSPQSKIFIDGRMPTWIETQPNGEKYWAYQQYNNILTGKEDANFVLQEYNVTTILWYRQDHTNFLSSKIRTKEWTKVYQDPIAIIFVKKLT